MTKAADLSARLHFLRETVDLAEQAKGSTAGPAAEALRKQAIEDLGLGREPVAVALALEVLRAHEEMAELRRQLGTLRADRGEVVKAVMEADPEALSRCCGILPLAVVELLRRPVETHPRTFAEALAELESARKTP